MERWKAALKKMLFPGGGWVGLLVFLGGVSLYLTFCVFGEDSPFAYVSYLLSACALTVLVTAAVPAAVSLRQALHRMPLTRRYLSDRYVQVRAGLLLSFFINLCYAGFKLVCAMRYVSFWDGGLAVYNMLLCAVRVYLLRRVPVRRQEPNRTRELHFYRVTGFFLLILNLALSAIAAQIVRDGQSYDYPGTLIYAAAFHAFYSLTLAMVNLVKYRRFNSPVLSAAKAVNLTTALVSLFSLETAMLARFGADQVRFRLIMTSCTAIAVCTAVLGMAVYMIVSPGRAGWRHTA